MAEERTQFDTAFYDKLYALPLYDALRFNNYGFSPLGDAAQSAAEPFQRQLYLELLASPPLAALVESQTPLLLEVGCGLAGGLQVLAERVGAGMAIGLDACAAAAQRAAAALRRELGEDAPTVVCAPAARMPFPPGAFDVVVMVESSGCFGDEARALAEAARVLREGGLLMVADYRRLAGEDTRDDLLRRAADAGFAVAHDRDITPNVVAACNEDAPRRAALVAEGVPPELQAEARHFAALPGTAQLEELAQGRAAYFIVALEKVATLPPPPPPAADGEADGDGEEDDSGSGSEAEDDGPPLPSFHDWRAVAPELGVLAEHWQAIRAEARALTLAGWTPWPEKHYATEQDDWRVAPFLYCFPAYEPGNKTWVERPCEACPQTAALLRGIPSLRTALLSRLGPGTVLTAHRGWADLANHVLRVHLPLVVPGDGQQCSLWVNGETRYLSEGELVVFDDSLLHKAANVADSERLVLIVDIARPEGMPLGRARGGHTKELDEFIAQFH